MNSQAERFRFFCDTFYGSVASFARTMEVKPPSLYGYFNGEKRFGSSMLKRFADAGGNVNWLLTGDGDPTAGTDLGIALSAKKSASDRATHENAVWVDFSRPASKENVDPEVWDPIIAGIKREFYNGANPGDLWTACSMAMRHLYPESSRLHLIQYFYDALISEDLDKWGYYISPFHREGWIDHLRTLNIATKATKATKAKTAAATRESSRIAKRIPLFLVPATAGYPLPFSDEYVEGWIDVEEMIIPNPQQMFAVRANGDSMLYDGIQTGDILLVSRGINPTSGSVVIATVDGCICVKRIETENDQISLVSSNHSYNRIKISDTNDLRILGVVTGVYHPISAPLRLPKLTS